MSARRRPPRWRRTRASAPSGRIVLVALLTAAALLAGAAAVPAQEPRPDVPATRPAATTGGWGAADVVWHPGSTVVAVTIAFPSGSAGDPESAPGATWLLGQVVQELVSEALAPAPRAATELSVEVDRSRTVFRMVTLPRHFEEAYRALEWAILRAEPTERAVIAARAGLGPVFAFEEDAPHREFELEFYRFLTGAGSSWSRPRRGGAGSTEGMTRAGLAGLRDRTLRQAEGVVSVVGAAPREMAARVVTGGPPLPEGGVAAPGFTPVSGRPSDPDVWDEEDRLVRTTEVTSTWIGFAWPVERDTSPTALEMLLHRLDRRFNPSPPDPGAFHVDVRVELLGSRRLLVVEAAVLPEAAGQWEGRVRSAVEAIADDEMDEAFFRAYRRRFRGSRLLQDAPPEVEGLRRAVDLLLDGRTRDLRAEISALDPDALQEAADDLGEPRILLFGPDLSEGSSW